MHVLILSPFFPPYYIGGAEIVAQELGLWLVRHGHRVTVLTAAAEGDPEQEGALEDGMTVWRLRFQRPYSVARHNEFGTLRKMQWHLQDNVDPRNLSALERVLDTIQPDIVNIHGLQGLGHNIPLVLGARNLPVVYSLHDYGLACVNQTLRKHGQPCEHLHSICSLTADWKWRCLDKVKRLSFWAACTAIYEELDRILPAGNQHHRRELIPYPMRFAVSDTVRERPEGLHLLYMGRFHELKGVRFLLSVCRRLAATHPFRLTLVGRGPEEAALKAEYGNEPWLRFLGFVPNVEVGTFMRVADALLVPSLWGEPYPLVIYQAVVSGLPVFASALGGMPEQVEEGQSGFLLPPGDEEAWYQALKAVCENPGKLQALKEGAREHARAFDTDLLGNRVLELFKWTAARPA